MIGLVTTVADPQPQVVHRAGGAMDLLHIGIGHLAVPAGHLQGAVSQQPLQAEHVTPVAEVADSGGVSQRMGRDAHAGDTGFASVIDHASPDGILGHAAAVPAEENLIQVGECRLGP